MTRRFVSLVGETTLYGFVAGAGVALLYAAVIAAGVDKQAMIVALLLLGVAVLVLVVAVLRISHPAPRETGTLPSMLEHNLAHERRPAGPRSRPFVHDEPTRLIEQDAITTVSFRVGGHRG